MLLAILLLPPLQVLAHESLKGVAAIATTKAIAANLIIQSAKVAVTSLAILIASAAAISLALLLLVLLFDFAILSIMQIEA
jgi:hypothetical protein